MYTIGACRTKGSCICPASKTNRLSRSFYACAPHPCYSAESSSVGSQKWVWRH